MMDENNKLPDSEKSNDATCENEMNPEEFLEYLIANGLVSESEIMRAEEKIEIAKEMRKALKDENYATAFSLAKKLKMISPYSYGKEAEKCFKICAEHDVFEAILYMAEKYVFRQRYPLYCSTEDFMNLKKLADRGYINSFRWLADCYAYGKGCERNPQMAQKYYFEGMLFGESLYCKERCIDYNWELMDYDGIDFIKMLTKKLLFADEDCCNEARIRIAELVYNGNVKEYDRESAYAILWRAYPSNTGIVEYLLGECVLKGIGTDPDPIVAARILSEAVDGLYDITEPVEGNKEWVNKILLESGRSLEEYQVALKNAESLLEEAEGKKKQLTEDEVAVAHAGLVDENQIFEKWQNAKPLFIKRRIE